MILHPQEVLKIIHWKIPEGYSSRMISAATAAHYLESEIVLHGFATVTEKDDGFLYEMTECGTKAALVAKHGGFWNTETRDLDYEQTEAYLLTKYTARKVSKCLIDDVMSCELQEFERLRTYATAEYLKRESFGDDYILKA